MVNVFITDDQHEDNQECLKMLVSKARLLGCNIWVRNMTERQTIVHAPTGNCFLYNNDYRLTAIEFETYRQMLNAFDRGWRTYI
jgi:hypothetical protein